MLAIFMSNSFRVATYHIFAQEFVSLERILINLSNQLANTFIPKTPE
jgi:hypothetical protein